MTGLLLVGDATTSGLSLVGSVTAGPPIGATGRPLALNPIGYVPLVLVALALLGLWAAGRDETTDRGIDALSRAVFGRYVHDDEERWQRLQSALVPTTYRTYAARTWLLVAVAAVAGGVVGVYLSGFVLLAIPPFADFLQGLPRTIRRPLGLIDYELLLSVPQVFAIVLFGGVLGSGGAAGVTYLWRWERPRNRAIERQRNIDAGLPRTVAFLYALVRGGVPVPTALRTLSRHRSIYGEGAAEFRVAVREMDLFGRDMITAVRRMANRTPSEEFKTFAENLASVLQSGRSLPAFLESQYERYQEEAADRQEDVIETLATIAEVYVTVLVAGVLFLITILLVFGLTYTDTLWLVQLVVYVMVPLANAGFVLYLGQKLSALGIGADASADALADVDTESPPRPAPRWADAGETHRSGQAWPAVEPSDSGGSTQADGGTVSESADGGAVTDPADAVAAVDSSGRGNGADGRLAALNDTDRFAAVRKRLGSPLETVLWQPRSLLWLTVPLAVLFVVASLPGAFTEGVFDVRSFDDRVVWASLFVLGSFALVWERHSRHVRRIESATPDLLERLASLNEAGMSLVESLDRVRHTDVGALSVEVRRLWADVRTGATLHDAWVRFGRRVRTVAITRVVTLLANAMQASGSLGPVLRIAARQARAELRLRRRRRGRMLSYLVVIYVSFAVFLVIVVAVQSVLVPALPTDVPGAQNPERLTTNVDAFARFGQVDKPAYTLVFFHAALIQAVLSGAVGGLLGEGRLADGAKHAAAMLLVAYVVFLALSSPVASIAMQAPDPGEGRAFADSVSLSNGGFVAVYEDDRNGTLLGHSEYLPPGSHSDVWIPLDRPPGDGDRLVAVVHRDTNGDRRFTPAGDVDDAYPASGRSSVVSVDLRVQEPRFVG